MTTPAFQARKDDELKKAILDGVEKEKGHSFSSELTPVQVDALVGTYGRSRSSRMRSQPSRATLNVLASRPSIR